MYVCCLALQLPSPGHRPPPTRTIRTLALNLWLCFLHRLSLYVPPPCSGIARDLRCVKQPLQDQLVHIHKWSFLARKYVARGLLGPCVPRPPACVTNNCRLNAADLCFSLRSTQSWPDTPPCRRNTQCTVPVGCVVPDHSVCTIACVGPLRVFPDYNCFACAPVVPPVVWMCAFLGDSCRGLGTMKPAVKKMKFILGGVLEARGDEEMPERAL